MLDCNNFNGRIIYFDMIISEQLIKEVWEKGKIVTGFPEDKIRKDACGAWIRREAYGDHDSPFGWDIDHIFPQKKLLSFDVPQSDIDDLRNLRPMQWKNNISKGADYPSYRSAVHADGDKNIEFDTFFTVNKATQENLNKLFDKYLR